jgi:hypothetical protein
MLETWIDEEEQDTFICARLTDNVHKEDGCITFKIPASWMLYPNEAIQKLVKMICKEQKEEYDETRNVILKISLSGYDQDQNPIYRHTLQLSQLTNAFQRIFKEEDWQVAVVMYS